MNELIKNNSNREKQTMLKRCRFNIIGKKLYDIVKTVRIFYDIIW